MSMEAWLLCQAQLERFAWPYSWLLGSNGGGLGFFLHNEMIAVRPVLWISKCLCVDTPLLAEGALEPLWNCNSGANHVRKTLSERRRREAIAENLVSQLPFELISSCVGALSQSISPYISRERALDHWACAQCSDLKGTRHQVPGAQNQPWWAFTCLVWLIELPQVLWCAKLFQFYVSLLLLLGIWIPQWSGWGGKWI